MTFDEFLWELGIIVNGNHKELFHKDKLINLFHDVSAQRKDYAGLISYIQWIVPRWF